VTQSLKLLTKSQAMIHLITEENHLKIIDIFVNPELDLTIQVRVAECLLNISAVIAFRKAMFNSLLQETLIKKALELSDKEFTEADLNF
jgi:hypothetical protein